MRIIDRISLHTLLKTILNFIIAVLQIIVPNKNSDTKPDRRIWKPRWRSKDE